MTAAGQTARPAPRTPAPLTSPTALSAAGRSPRWLSVVGLLGVIALGFTVWLGLWITPPDAVQGNLARLLYIHPPIATVALYWAGGVALVGSLLYLWPRTRSLFWDRLAASAVEVGAVFAALTLVTGSLWGRPAWGVWWTWDARLTSTALLLLLEIGYLALRRVPADPAVRARRCAVAAILIAIDVPIVHFSVDWWNTLHQGGTFVDPGFRLHAHGSMAWTFLLGFIALSLIFVWLLGMRYRIEVLQDHVGDQELEVSLAERWDEGAGPDGPGAGAAVGVGVDVGAAVGVGVGVGVGDRIESDGAVGTAPPRPPSGSAP
jgi:heme exporter protein C